MPSQNIAILTLTVVAAAFLPPHRFVTATGALAAFKGHALGVTRAEAASGTLTPVDVLGTAQVEAAEPIVAGALLRAFENGKAVGMAFDMGGNPDGVAVARALQAAGGDGDVIEVLLIPN